MLTYSYVLVCPRLELIPSHGITVGPGVDYVTLTVADPQSLLDFFETKGILVKEMQCLNPELVQRYVEEHGVRKLGHPPPHLLPSEGEPTSFLGSSEED